MAIFNAIDKMKRQILVGRTSKMLKAGYSVEEIAKKLKLTESQVRPLVAVCHEADRKKAELETARDNAAD